ncbi:hypothetical protein Patl1_29645 [Pistacia atlantica]|uniref:Uncharacterized protein n=1 Tax=Pistacia atlantica TaxID=434234 RepID=A0ACC1AFN6_9ROSI|nr:hypothetical protein Patl1_29645 [Pistacia atlantica]
MEIVERESEQIEGRECTKIDIDYLYLPLANSVKRELDSLHPLSAGCTIHRVPESLRQLDEKAFKPRIVSIGPIHHGRQELKAMEKYKRRYLADFLQRTEVSLVEFIKVIKEKEEMVRNCYAESIELNSDDFVKMILMDGIFIIEVLLRNIMEEIPISDRVFSHPYIIHDINDDMYLLENQLPFFILEDLFTRANIDISSDKDDNKLSIHEMTHEFTRFHWGFLGIENHFEKSNYLSVKHLVHFLRISMKPYSGIESEKRPKILTTPSVTQLKKAGVKFKLGSTSNLFALKFKNGILEIPQLNIYLLAFEQCQCNDNLLSDYVILMNYLVNTPKDVELLVRHEIVENPLGDNSRVSTLFHKLVEQITFDAYYFHFSSLAEDLNKYCKAPWHKWKAILKQDYFKTPWTTVSVIAAIVLLVLTLIQTFCDVINLMQVRIV